MSDCTFLHPLESVGNYVLHSRPYHPSDIESSRVRIFRPVFGMSDSPNTPSASPATTIVRLRYPTPDGVSDLPDWAQFYLRLGSFLASPLEHVGERRILGLATPTRAFAAPFSAVGAVIGAFGNVADKTTDGEYFDLLCSLPSNTAVKLRGQNRKGREVLFDGILKGSKEISGNRMIEIQVEKASMTDSAAGGLTRYIPCARVREVTLPAGEDAVTVASLPTSQKGTKISPTGGFARSVVGPKIITEFESESRMCCLMVGSAAVLGAELSEHKFRAESGAEGSLSELLRVKRYLTPGNSFLSNIFATNSRRPPRYEGDLAPHLVIFDGAPGFLKWRDNFPASHWLVLLDQTEPSFEAARDTLNNIYLQRNGSDPDLDGIPVLPEGVEMIFFQERMR